MGFRVGIDIGGTFTDFALLNGTHITLHKNLSTPEDRSLGVMQGLEKLAEIEGLGVADFLDLAFGVIGIDDWSQYVRVDPAQLRPAEVDVLIGDATKVRSVLGWKPRMSFVELVQTMVESDIRAQPLSVPGSL